MATEMTPQGGNVVGEPPFFSCPRCGHEQLFDLPRPVGLRAYLASVCQGCGWTYYGPKEATP